MTQSTLARSLRSAAFDGAHQRIKHILREGPLNPGSPQADRITAALVDALEPLAGLRGRTHEIADYARQMLADLVAEFGRLDVEAGLNRTSRKQMMEEFYGTDDDTQHAANRLLDSIVARLNI